jgi:hypothetical protein
VVAPFLALAPTVAAWTLTSASVLLYYVYPDPSMPSYEARFATLTVATLAAFALDLWIQGRRARVAGIQPPANSGAS